MSENGGKKLTAIDFSSSDCHCLLLRQHWLLSSAVAAIVVIGVGAGGLLVLVLVIHHQHGGVGPLSA